MLEIWMVVVWQIYKSATILKRNLPTNGKNGSGQNHAYRFIVDSLHFNPTRLIWDLWPWFYRLIWPTITTPVLYIIIIIFNLPYGWCYIRLPPHQEDSSFVPIRSQVCTKAIGRHNASLLSCNGSLVRVCVHARTRACATPFFTMEEEYYNEYTM